MILHFLNDIFNGIESIPKLMIITDNCVIIASLKSEPTYKLINRIPGLHLLISSLPSSALRMHVESLSKPRAVSKYS